MTDVPGTGVPGEDSEPYVPSGVRRSTYTPPDQGTPSGDFDDDALAEALAAQVAPYTAPVPVTPPQAAPVTPPPASTPPSGSIPTGPTFDTGPVFDTGPAFDTGPTIDTGPADPSPTIDPPALDTSTSPTLEAIERLESELRRRAEEAQAAAGPPADVEPAAPFEPPAPVETPAPVEPAAPVEPPALVEPPPPTWSDTGSIVPSPFAPPPAAPAFGPPTTSPVDLPPPMDLPPPAAEAPLDFARLPPPVGLEPAPIPPYDPTAEVEIPMVPLGPPVDLPPPPGQYAPPADDDLVTDTDDEVVDEVDRAFGTGATPIDSTGTATILAPPSQPIPTVRLADDEVALVDEEPESHPALVVESAGPEPTALDLRAGHAARLFWLWFAANSSVVSLALGAVMLGLGMSLRQALVATFLGIALSCLPLGLGTLAGKWSGQPTMIVSRATFGLVGNALPAVLAVVSRVFWGGALLWVLSAGVARVLVDAGLDAGLGEQVWTFVGLGVGFTLAFGVATFGYGLVARVQMVLSIVTGILVVGVVAITFPRIDIPAAQTIDDGPWTLLLTGVVLVFSFVGLAWVHSSADVARYQRTDSDGGSTMLWATFGVTLPALLLVAWGALLAASDPLIAEGLTTNPLYTIAALLPAWYPAPLLAALALGLLSGVVLTIYSGGFALQALGIRARRSGTTVIAGALVLAAAFALLLLVTDAQGLIRDVATTIAVPIAAWAGIFGAEIMIRRRRFDSAALLRRGGVYPAVRWVNLVGLVAISAIGFGFTSAALPGLDWQGYLFPFLGLSGGDPLLSSDVGVLGALVLGILVPLVSAVPAIRRQERALID